MDWYEETRQNGALNINCEYLKSVGTVKMIQVTYNLEREELICSICDDNVHTTLIQCQNANHLYALVVFVQFVLLTFHSSLTSRMIERIILKRALGSFYITACSYLSQMYELGYVIPCLSVEIHKIARSFLKKPRQY